MPECQTGASQLGFLFVNTVKTWRVESDGVPSVEPPGEIFEEAGSLVHIEDDRSPGPGHGH